MPEKKVLGTVGYKPYGSVLTVTNQRIVGKRSGIGIGGFKGEILIRDIVSLSYKSGIPGITIPRLVIEHRLPDGNIEKSTIHFHGSIPRIFSGFSKPKQIYQLIQDLVNKERTSEKP